MFFSFLFSFVFQTPSVSAHVCVWLISRFLISLMNSDAWSGITVCFGILIFIYFAFLFWFWKFWVLIYFPSPLARKWSQVLFMEIAFLLMIFIYLFCNWSSQDYLWLIICFYVWFLLTVDILVDCPVWAQKLQRERMSLFHEGILRFLYIYNNIFASVGSYIFISSFRFV